MKHLITIFGVTISITLVFLISSCNKSSNEDNRNNKTLKEYLNKKSVYLVQVYSSDQRDSLVSFAKKLSSKVNYNIYITKDHYDSNKLNSYKLNIGKFRSSFQAGRKAYELYSEGIIGNPYRIVKNQRIVFDKFADLLFTGKAGYTSGIYRINIFTNNYKQVWSKHGEIVADLDYSPENNTAYFITIADVGYNGIFPYIKKVKLYIMDVAGNKVKLVENFGDGIQIFSHWEPSGLYRLVFLSFDKKNPIRILENDWTLNESGIPINEEHRTIDLVKENYPQPPVFQNEKMSPDGRFSFEESTQKEGFRLSLVDIRNGRRIEITTSKKKLNRYAWTKDSKYLVFSTLNVTTQKGSLKNKDYSNLCIYNIREKKITTIGGKEGFKNFLLRDDLIIFDDGFDSKSRIFIYNINQSKLVNTISIKGGCGINNIPSLPGNK